MFSKSPMTVLPEISKNNLFCGYFRTINYFDCVAEISNDCVARNLQIVAVRTFCSFIFRKPHPLVIPKHFSVFRGLSRDVSRKRSEILDILRKTGLCEPENIFFSVEISMVLPLEISWKLEKSFRVTFLLF